MKVFITGGTGYIGSRVVRELIADGHEPHVLSRTGSAPAGASVAQGELTDTALLRRSAAEADAVIHLALASSRDAAAIDLEAAQNMLDVLGDRPYIHTSGAWIWGNTDGVVDEAAPFDPPRLTSWRPANDRAVLDTAAIGHRPVVIAPGLVYGHDGGLIDLLYAAPARTTGVVSVIGDGANYWSMVHVDDLARAYVAALAAPAGEIFAAVDDSASTQLEIARAVAGRVGGGVTVATVAVEDSRATKGPFGEALALDQRVSNQKARTRLSWEPVHADPAADIAAGS